MSGGGGEVRDKQLALTDKELALADQQNARSGKMFDLAFPGMEKATDYYTRLASGDPKLIQAAMAPATEAITQQADVAKTRIQNEMPRGGEQHLAKEMVDINSAGQIGQNATKAFTSAFPALTSIGTSGIGLSINQIANAISSMGQAGQGYNSVMQADAANKAASMGMLSGLAGAGGEIGAAAIAACWIAEVLYGKHNIRTYTLRYWLNHKWAKRSKFGAWVMALYRKHGIKVAGWVRNHWYVRIFFRPIFNFGLRRAQRELAGVK